MSKYMRFLPSVMLFLILIHYCLCCIFAGYDTSFRVLRTLLLSERFFYFSFQHIGSISVSGDKFTLFQGNNSSLLHFFKRIFRDDYT